MFTIIQNLSAASLFNKGIFENQEYFKLEHIDKYTLLSPATTGVVDQNDVFHLVAYDATVYNEGTILAYNHGNHSLTYESLYPEIATVSQTGEITRVSNGITPINVMNGVTKQLSVDVRETTAAQIILTTSWQPSSLGLDAATNIDSRIAGLDQETNGYIYSSQDHTTKIFVRDPDCWASDIDLTCISPSNSLANNLRAGTLITPRHMIGAAHYELNIGNIVYFVTQDGTNTTVPMTITGKKQHPDYSNYFPDLTVYTLNDDVPSTITPCKTLPASYINKLVEIEAGSPPTLCLDQEEKALVTDLHFFSSKYATFRVPTDATRFDFYEHKINGDSGNPGFLVLDLGSGPEVIILTVWTYLSPGLGTFVTPQIDAINQMIIDSDAIAGVSTGYTVTEADLSTYTTYA